MLTTKWILHIGIVTFVLVTLISESDARGGRRGGSMGGLFGSWRKYKKPSSSSGGSSRRIVSSSPVHTPITKALNEKKAAEKFAKNGKPYNGKYNAPPLPAGGSYYANTATLPANAVYIAQAPPRGSEFGDFLTGYLTGRLLTMGMAPYHTHHQYVTHVYHENPNQETINATNSSKVIVIDNNNQPTTTGLPSSSQGPSIARLTASPIDSTTDVENSSTEINPTATSYTTNSYTTPEFDTSPKPATYGVICMPFMVNEENSSGDTVPVERTVCYPAPAPMTPVQSEVKSKPVEIAGDIVEH